MDADEGAWLHMAAEGGAGDIIFIMDMKGLYGVKGLKLGGPSLRIGLD